MKPLQQFEVKPWIPLHIFGVDVSITNSAAFMLMAVISIFLFFFFTLRKTKNFPSQKQSLAEMSVHFISSTIKDINGTEGLAFLPFICSVFFFVLMGNILGLLPYGFTFTGQLIVNMALALIVFFVSTIVGFIRQGSSYFRVFCPEGVPLLIMPILIPVEIVSYLSRPISLSVRLFANMLAGHTLMKIVGYFSVMMGVWGIFPIIFNMTFTIFELFVAFLQAYVFAILSCVYLNDALKGHS